MGHSTTNLATAEFYESKVHCGLRVAALLARRMGCCLRREDGALVILLVIVGVGANKRLSYT